MNQKDIDRLLTCRKIIDNHNTNRSSLKDDAAKKAAVEEYMSVLKDNGFSSVSEFETFNKFMNFCSFLECIPLQGKCDNCEGYKGTPPCVERYKEEACFYNPIKTIDDFKYLFAGEFFIKSSLKISKGISLIFCPEGHGFYNDDSKCTELPFDITWSVYK
jgi:hypothetical protein